MISPGQLTLWDVRVRTPIGNITAGKVVFHKGCSLQFSFNRTSEYLMLEREFCVPDILGRLVCSGLLPKSVMSWFNPEYWPRYRSDKQPAGPSKNTLDPDYYFFGGIKETGQSIIQKMHDGRFQ